MTEHRVESWNKRRNIDPQGLEELAFAEMAACQGMEILFTAEPRDLSMGTRRGLKALCAGCPVRQLCREFAQRIQPSAGVWAGTLYTETGERDL